MTASRVSEVARQSAENARRWIGLLFQPGDVIEIRALSVDRDPSRGGITYSGYFNVEASDDISKALIFYGR